MAKKAEQGGAGMNATERVAENLNEAAWKLHGLAGLFKLREEGSVDVILNAAEAHGLSLMLKEIAEDVADNADLITED